MVIICSSNSAALQILINDDLDILKSHMATLGCAGATNTATEATVPDTVPDKEAEAAEVPDTGAEVSDAAEAAEVSDKEAEVPVKEVKAANF